MKAKSRGILVAGKLAAKAFSSGGDLLVAYKAAMRGGDGTRSLGENVGDGVVDRVIRIAVVGLVIPLDIQIGCVGML